MASVIPDLSVVIPVFRSADTLAPLLARLHDVFAAGGFHAEVVMVDDASQDGSWEALKGQKAKHGPWLRIARLMRRSGQHNALLCGLSLARGERIVTMDDDLQNPPEEIPTLLAALDQGHDLVIAAYDTKQHSALRNLGGRFVDWVIRRAFQLPAGFQLTGFRATRRAVVEAVLQMGGAFPYLTCMLLSCASSYANATVRHEPRRSGRSGYGLTQSLGLAMNLLLTLYLVRLHQQLTRTRVPYRISELQ